MVKSRQPDLHRRLAFLLISLGFLTLRAFDAVPRFSDGSIYLYMSSLLREGVLPYRDFFFAHPPLQLLFLSPVTFLFSDNFFMTHMSLQLLLVANAWVLFSISNKFFPAKTSLLAPLLYLFSYSIPATGAHWSGVHLALFLVLSTLLMYLNNRTVLAGILAGLALFTRYYALIPLLGMCIGAVVLDRKKALGTVVITFGLVLVTSLTLLLPGFESFWEQTVDYHLKKTEGIPKSRILLYFASHEWLLVLGFAAGVWALRDRSFWLILFPQIVLLVFYLGFADIYYYYFVLIIPFLILNLVHFVEHSNWTGNRSFHWALGLVIVFYLTSSGYRYLTGHARIDNFAQLDDVAEWISNQSDPGDSIYGAAELTPLLALHAGVPITGNHVDTNQKIFLTGTVSTAQRQNDLLKEGIRYFITLAFVQGIDIAGLERYVTIEFLQAHCTQAYTSPLTVSYQGNTLLIWDCKKN